VAPKLPARSEDAVKRLEALRTLAGASPFVVRLYSAWTGDPAADDAGSWLDGEIAGYTGAGLSVELVIRYKPATPTSDSPAAFARHVRSIVRRYGRNARFVSLQVTNEANMPGAPEASDGAFAGVTDALVSGVIAAKDQVRKKRLRQLRVGFSWAYGETAQTSTQFWAALARRGGRAFASAVDWVGLDSYPGTWAPQIAPSGRLPQDAASAVKNSVRALRDCYMPMAGLGKATTIHIAENGYPTGPGRSADQQAQILAAMVGTVTSIRATYGITDYRWFDLRDSSSTDSSIESQYGITYDDYTPKPAFSTYANLISLHSKVVSRPVRRGGGRRAGTPNH
jgi:hypothetical protein